MIYVASLNSPVFLGTIYHFLVHLTIVILLSALSCSTTSHYVIRYSLFIFLFLKCSLQILNVSGNNLESIRDLECIRGMTQFMANDNQLSDLKELAHCLSMWRNCWRLELAGNAFCHKAKYRDRVIIMSNSLGKCCHHV